jgi:cobalt/nickel transport system permease protein
VKAMNPSAFKTLSMDERTHDGWFARLDARAKLVGVLCFVVVTAVLTRYELVFLSLIVAVALAAASAVSPVRLAKMYIVAMPLILAASLSVFLFGGWVRGITMWARTSSCVVSLLVVSLGTDSFDLFSGLRRLRVPWIITTLLMLTQRYIILLSSELSRMTVARKARGFQGARNLLDRYGLRVIAFTAGMVLVRSLRRADNIYEGLKGKGFSKDMRPWRNPRFATAEAAFTTGMVAMAAALLMAQIGVVA